MYSLKPCVEELERFYNFLNEKFGLNLTSDVVITIQTRGRKNAKAWFCAGVWKNHQEPSVNEINICAESLTDDAYESLAHEMAHFCELKSRGKLSKNNYHSKTFKEQAEKLLLKVSQMGNYGFAKTERTDEFNKMLFEFKPKKEVFDLLRRGLPNKEKQPTKMKKWTCGCVIVRCAVELNATCENCKKKFEKVGE